jgi:hypothetical protein
MLEVPRCCEAAGDLRRGARYSRAAFPAMPASFKAFQGLTELELSASHLGNLANLSSLPGLVRCLAAHFPCPTNCGNC